MSLGTLWSLDPIWNDLLTLLYCIQIRACEQAQTLSSDCPYSLIICLLLIRFGLDLHNPAHTGAKQVENAPESNLDIYLFTALCTYYPYSFLFFLN